MTQVAERSEVPLTNPVPGAWLQLPNGMPPVYVPFEPQYRKNEATGKDEVIGHAPGAHIKRLLSDGAMYANMPSDSVPAPVSSETEAALREQLAQMKQAQDALMEELAALREKMAGDPHVPNAAKRSR